MKYSEFKNKFQNLPVIQAKEAIRLDKHNQAMRNQLTRWQKKGLLVKLKRSYYLLNENDRKISPTKCFIANLLYQPSYVSLEYALSRYGLIPERVTDITSITTKKTTRFNNKLGSFIYQHIKRQAFRGFESLKETNSFSCLIAGPEKAVVDFLYLNLSKLKGDTKAILGNSYRFQNLGILKKRKIMEFARIFNNCQLTAVSSTFCEFIKERK